MREIQLRDAKASLSSVVDDAVRGEPAITTRHGRRELVLMSSDHYDGLVAAARRTHRTTDAAAVVADAVRRAEMAELVAELLAPYLTPDNY